MALIHNDVFDAALTEVATATKAEVRNASSAVLVGSVVLNAGNYGAIGDYTSGSSTGRTRTCLVSSASDMKNISVASAGSATKVALVDAGSVDLIVASITSAPVSLGASDQVNLGSFAVVLLDP